MKQIIAIVGMAGAGKSAACEFFKKRNIPVLRFGDLTEEIIKEKGLELNPQNERKVREQLRDEQGMGAYAVAAKPKIEELVEKNPLVVLDGLYSWEEYIYLIRYFSGLQLLHIYAPSALRYERLSKRAVRPLTAKEARERDFAEIESLNKGGPIAIADYMVRNEEGVNKLHADLGEFLKGFGIN